MPSGILPREQCCRMILPDETGLTSFLKSPTVCQLLHYYYLLAYLSYCSRKNKSCVSLASKVALLAQRPYSTNHNKAWLWKERRNKKEQGNKKKEIKLLLSLDGLKDPSFTKASLTKTNAPVITHPIVMVRWYFHDISIFPTMGTRSCLQSLLKNLMGINYSWSLLKWVAF